MKKIVIAVMLVGCAYGKTPPDPGLAAPTPKADQSGICCQTTQPEDMTWGYVRSECSPDSGVDYVNIPWVCNPDFDSGAVLSCSDPNCNLGMPCLGFNGMGVVVSCDQVIY